jgi:hypothetical protein
VLSAAHTDSLVTGRSYPGAVVPRFYFDVITPDAVVHDSTGGDAPDAATAMHGCISGMQDMLEQGLLEAGGEVIVRNAHGRIIMSLNIAALRGSMTRSN